MGFEDQSIRQEQAQINITPLVDVLLVLLVIFMMTAPVLSRPIPLTLPQSAPPDAERLPPPEPIRLRIDAAGGLSWNGNATSLSALPPLRSEEHTSELQSLMRISYAVFCLKKKTK